MAEEEISQKEIESLAWAMISRFLLTLDCPNGPLVVADLHPGGGTYDCLSLIETSPNPKPILLLNRNGTSARVNGKNVSGVWRYAQESGVRKTVDFILSEVDEQRATAITSQRSLQARICLGISSWIKKSTENSSRAVCAWRDDTYYVGQYKSLLGDFVIPKAWSDLDAPYVGSDWSAWIYILCSDTNLTAAVNLSNGEAIVRDGTSWREWDQFLPKAKPVAKRQNPKKFISLPPQEFNSESLELFRTIGKFDGYKVFGKDLGKIATEIADNWHSGIPLPEDLIKLRGALFFESRRAHFTDGYPDKSDLPYLREIVRHIQHLENLEEEKVNLDPEGEGR